MEEIKNYTIVAAVELTTLIQEVRGLIAEGWEPIGGASHDRYKHEPRAGRGTVEVCEYIQAMIRKQPLVTS